MKKNKDFPIVFGRLAKTVIMVKLTFFLISISMFCNANSVFSQKQKITINQSNVSLKQVLWKIEKQAGIVFVYSTEDLDNIIIKEVKAKNKPADEVIESCLKNTNLKYEIHNDVIIINKKPLEKAKEVPQFKVKTVTGIVKDVNGQPLPGVSVVVKGTTKGVSTDVDGKFTIKFEDKKGVELVFSFVGMKDKILKVGKSDKYDVVMLEDTESLSEVVVTGYANRKTETYTGSSVAVGGEKLAKTNMDVSFMKSLQGQAAGVLVIDQGFDPNSEPKIRIRGTGSISAQSNPLIIMDGVQIASLSSINPNDVKSITVQKDATATAIYGSRGSNGVIIITTKKGKKGTVKVNYSFRAGVSDYVTGKNINLMSSVQKLNYEKDLGIKTEDEVNEFLKQGYNTNWKSKLWDKNTSMVHTLSILGGSGNTKYSLSFGYHDETSIYGTDYKKYNGRISLDTKLNDRLEIGVNLLLASSETDDKRVSGILDGAFKYLPYYNGYDEDGEILKKIGTLDYALYKRQYKDDVDNAYNINAIGYLKYKIIDNLYFKSNWGISKSISKSKSFEDPTIASKWTPSDEKGMLTNKFGDSYILTGTQMFSYSKTFAEDHTISAIAGFEFNESEFERFYATGVGFVNGKVQALDSASKAKSTKGDKSHSGMLSYLSQLSYTYQGKYFSDLSFRRDGSSKFGENNKYANFWSIGGGWNVHKENFWGVDFINNLKLKFSVGTSGNSSISDFQAKMLYAYDASYAGNPAIYPTNLENPDLTWERNFNIGYGVNFGILDSRITGSVDFYTRKTKDLLLAINPLGTSGFASVQGGSSYMENIGEMTNSGIDISIHSLNLKLKDFTWTSELNLSYNKNEVNKLYRGEDIKYTHFIYKEGEKAASLYGVEWVGVNPETGKNQFKKLDGSITEEYSEDDRKVLGTSTPPYYGGFSNTFRYKNFELTALFTFMNGHESFNMAKWDLRNQPSKYNQSTDVLKAWKKKGDKAELALRSDNYSDKDPKYTTQYLEDASFVKFKSLSISYNLNNNWVKKIGLNNLNINFQTQNLMVWTDFSISDPEMAGYTAGFAPMVRKFAFGLSANF